MTAAAILGLIVCADEIDFSSQDNNKLLSNGTGSPLKHKGPELQELLVGYTGGCISHFQDYLKDCQHFLDAIMDEEFGVDWQVRVRA